MPGGDRTGPMGMGPMTGRGLGYCAGFGVPGTMQGGFWGGWGRGRGRAPGRGRGWRNMFHATGLTGWQRAAMGFPFWGGGQPVPPPAVSKEAELQMLRAQADAAAATLDQLRQRIDELTAATKPAEEQQ